MTGIRALGTNQPLTASLLSFDAQDQDQFKVQNEARVDAGRGGERDGVAMEVTPRDDREDRGQRDEQRRKRPPRGA